MAFRLRTAIVRLAVTTATCLTFLGSWEEAQAGPPPTSASPADKKAAQQKYDAGVKLFKARHFKEALASFRSSYDTVASPATHLMIGKSMKELGQLVEAFDELDQAELEAQQLAAAEPRYASIAESAGKERDQLRARVAVITVRLKGADSVQSLTVGGRSMPPATVGRAIAVQPGAVEVVAMTGDGRRVDKQGNATVGAATDIELEASGRPDAAASPLATAPSPVAPPADQHPSGSGSSEHASLLPYAAVAGGIGVVGVGVFAVFGIMSKNKYDDLDATCKPNCSQDDLDKGKQLQIVANVGLVVGAVGVATGIALFAIDRSRSGSSAAAPAASSNEPTARVFVGPGSLQVRGGF